MTFTKSKTGDSWEISHSSQALSILSRFQDNLIVLLQFIKECLPPLPRFLLYVAEGDCIIKASLEKRGVEQGKIKSTYAFFYSVLVRIFLVWFHITYAFNCFSSVLFCFHLVFLVVVVIMCYNVKMDRDYLSLFGSLAPDTEMEVRV